MLMMYVVVCLLFFRGNFKDVWDSTPLKRDTSYWKKNSKPKNKKGPVGPVPSFWAEAFADLD